MYVQSVSRTGRVIFIERIRGGCCKECRDTLLRFAWELCEPLPGAAFLLPAVSVMISRMTIRVARYKSGSSQLMASRVELDPIVRRLTGCGARMNMRRLRFKWAIQHLKYFPLGATGCCPPCMEVQ